MTLKIKQLVVKKDVAGGSDTVLALAEDGIVYEYSTFSRQFMPAVFKVDSSFTTQQDETGTL